MLASSSLIKQSGENSVILSTHVDDILIISKNLELIHSVEEELKKIYDLTINEVPHSYLGMQIEQNRELGTLKLSMPGYTQRILNDYLTNKNFRTATTPFLPAQTDSTKNLDPLSGSEQQLYMTITGSLLFLAISTRPDILQPVHVLTQFLKNPSQQHLKSAYRILAYLSGSVNLDITFRNDEKFTLQAFADSSFANNHDR